MSSCQALTQRGRCEKAQAQECLQVLQELQTSTSEHSVIFGKFKGTGTRRLQTVEKGSRQLSLKQNKAK